MIDLKLSQIEGFEWNEGNSTKNWDKHQVTNYEAEEIFKDENRKIHNDTVHSQKEERFWAYGKTGTNRKLFIVFTIRNNFIRIISARNMNKKEIKTYEKET